MGAPKGQERSADSTQRKRIAVDASEVDAEIQNAENELSRQLLIKRLRVAGLVGVILIIVATISAMIIYREQAANRDSAVFGVGPPVLYFSLVGIAVFAWLLYDQRDMLVQLRTTLKSLRSRKKDLLAGSARSRLGILVRYKNDLPDLVNGFRLTARKYGRTHNMLQVVVIGGSLSTSSLIAASGSTPWGRGAGVIGALIVSASAAYSAYFKFKEKSLNLQRTADEIEREHRAVELRIGDYEGKPNEQALSEFVTKVEALRANQHRQQLELDQPADVQYRGAVAPEQDQ